MGTEKNLELHIPSILGSEKAAMNFAASAAKNMGFTGERIEDLKAAVFDAVTELLQLRRCLVHVFHPFP